MFTCPRTRPLLFIPRYIPVSLCLILTILVPYDCSSNISEHQTQTMILVFKDYKNKTAHVYLIALHLNTHTTKILIKAMAGAIQSYVAVCHKDRQYCTHISVKQFMSADARLLCYCLSSIYSSTTSFSVLS